MTQEQHHESGIHMPDQDDHGELLRRRQVMRRAKLLSAVVLVLLAVGAGRTVMSRMSNSTKLEEGTVEPSKL